MFVICAKIKGKSGVQKFRLAGRKSGIDYGTGDACWCEASDLRVKYFNSVESAEYWFEEEKYDLIQGIDVLKLAIAEVTYSPVQYMPTK